jgi:hypothetical protein
LKTRLARQLYLRSPFVRHPFRDAGDRSVGLRDDNEIDAAICESPVNRHILAAAWMERICDPYLNLVLAGQFVVVSSKTCFWGEAAAVAAL